MAISSQHGKPRLNRQGLQIMSQIMPLFLKTPEGSLESERVRIQFTPKLKKTLGLSFVFDHLIQLNLQYFSEFPERLAHTLFHELTHLWLYDCNFDPGHTKRFFKKMTEFTTTGFQVDHELADASPYAREAPFVYHCQKCSRRWHLHQALSYSIYCGQCFDQSHVRYPLAVITIPCTPPRGTHAA